MSPTLPPQTPHSPDNPIPGASHEVRGLRCQQEKKTLPGAASDVSGPACVTTYPLPGHGILTVFPFDSRGDQAKQQTTPLPNGISLSLRSGSLTSNCGVDSSVIRQVSFTLVDEDGFATEPVDQALWRLEEAFAKRERAGRTEEVGEAGYFKQIRAQAQEILDRVARPEKEKFRRATGLRQGYSVRDVDDFCNRLVSYFQGQEAISVATVRNQKFRTQLGGYDEIQVDRVLDETVSVILAVR
jgi:DivIVA domain-containing protein